MMTDLRKILLTNYKNGNVDKIKSRWSVLTLLRSKEPFADHMASLTGAPETHLDFSKSDGKSSLRTGSASSKRSSIRRGSVPSRSFSSVAPFLTSPPFP